MRKVTDFIIEKRNYVLTIFIILSVVCLYLSTKVHINYDLTEYLPSTSETRIGMDIMNDEFPELDTSALNVMFKDLSTEDKNKIKDELENIEGVSSVTYDDSDKYNKDEYTLYEITVDGADDSKNAANVYKSVKDNYKDYEVYTSGEVATRNAPVLNIAVIALAIFCAMIILIIMCDSYVEPFLFLFVIGLAVFLNKGTNIIFSSVSNITTSICAILQMALSMDYSIMLMNRYTQEKEHTKNKEEAMKNALYHSFGSISSSSVTTIVGLLALVFMSFTIGRDLGIVLAKGVIFSLISIFLALPALILMFDSLIEKTQKKHFTMKLDWLGNFSFGIRHMAIFLFIIIFALSYFLKGNLQYEFTSNEQDDIARVFKENNQIALIYPSNEEDYVGAYCRSLEGTEKIDQILCYGNTINEPLKYDELKNKFSDLGQDVDIDDYVLKLIYFNYYNKQETTMTFNDLVTFIETKVYPNAELSKEITPEIRENITKLKNFTSIDALNKKRTSREIASILGVSKDQVDQLFILYNATNPNTKITLPELANFINNYVLKNDTYKAYISEDQKALLKEAKPFLSKNNITTKKNSSEIANMFELSKDDVDKLFMYYESLQDINEKLTINEFVKFTLDKVYTNPEYQALFTDNTVASLKLLKVLSNKEIINTKMDIDGLAKIFDLSKDDINSILDLKNVTINGYTPAEIKELLTKYKDIIEEKTGLDVDKLLAKLEEALKNAEITDEEVVTLKKIASIFGIPEEKIDEVIGLIKNKEIYLTPYEFVNLILENKDNAILSKILDEKTIETLNLAKNIMESTNNGIKYKYSDMAKLIGTDDAMVKQIYTLYHIMNTNTMITPMEFAKFLLNHQNDEMLKGSLDNNSLSKLTLVNTVMDSVYNNTKYSYYDMANLINASKDDLKLLYSLYEVQNGKKVTLSLDTFVNYLLDNVVNDRKYAPMFTDDMKSQLNTVRAIMESVKKNTKFNLTEMLALINPLVDNIDKNTMDLLFIYYGSVNHYNEDWTLTVEEFVRYINDDILTDSRFDDFIDKEMRAKVSDAKTTIGDAKELLVGKDYNRAIFNTTLEAEGEETYNFITAVKDHMNGKNAYVIGDSPMALEMSKSFDGEMNLITVLTMIFIFVVVAFTFKSILIPIILVFLIQCAVYITMDTLTFAGGSVYFIALLIVQSILMGATIDYAILYTSYYLESRRTMDIKEALINSYNKSIHTILTSASILIIVTLIVGKFASHIAAMICKTISIGTLCSMLLMLIILPSMLACADKLIIKNKKVN
mgnify:FL=1